MQWPFHPQLRPLSTVPLCTVSKTIALLHKLLHCYRTYCAVTETIALCHSRGFRSLESYADHHHPGSSASTWQMCTRMHLHKHAARPPPYMKLHLSERGFTKTYKQIAQVPSPFCLMQNFTNPAFTVEWQWCTLQCIVHCYHFASSLSNHSPSSSSSKILIPSQEWKPGLVVLIMIWLGYPRAARPHPSARNTSRLTPQLLRLYEVRWSTKTLIPDSEQNCCVTRVVHPRKKLSEQSSAIEIPNEPELQIPSWLSVCVWIPVYCIPLLNNHISIQPLNFWRLMVGKINLWPDPKIFSRVKF